MQGGKVNIRDVLMACAIKDNISDGAKIALVNTMALIDREREQVRFTEFKSAFKQTFTTNPSSGTYFEKKTLVGTMIMTIRNIGTVGPVPETATEAGAGTSVNGTSLHIGLGGTVPTPHQLGTTTGQVLHFIASMLGVPVKQTFCWIPGPSAAV